MPDIDLVAAKPPFPVEHPTDGPSPRPARKRAFLNGKLVYGDGIFAPDGSFTQDCTIHNISEGGAKVVLSQRQFLPPDVYLIVVKQAIAYQAKVVWLDYPARGLKFLKAYTLTAGLPEDLKFLHRLWAELGTRSGVIELPD